MKPNAERRGGFTVLEMVISVTIMSVVMASVFQTTQRGFAIFHRSSANSDINARSARAINRILWELLETSESSFTPNLDTAPGDPTFWTPTLDFQDATGWAGNALVLGPARRITWQLASGELLNNLDDNGNGLIDEGAVRLVLDPTGVPQTVTLANGVSEFLEGELPNGADDNGNGLVDERGLAFSLVNDVLTVRLTIERIGPAGERMLRTQEASLVVRN